MAKKRKNPLFRILKIVVLSIIASIGIIIVGFVVGFFLLVVFAKNFVPGDRPEIDPASLTCIETAPNTYVLSFNWKVVDKSKTYDVVIDELSSYPAGDRLQNLYNTGKHSTVSSPTHSYSVPAARGHFYDVAVWAQGVLTKAGLPSGFYTVECAAPPPPTNLSAVCQRGRITFAWNPVAAAVKYHIAVTDTINQQWNNKVATILDDDTTITADNMYYEKGHTYQWGVISHDDGNNQSTIVNGPLITCN